ncbi:hypothetical protein [Treponema berlinense]|uniref:hypothetical protein n=1 Tax=Treponema berlinense TaxID=225004 RepID=UPI0026E94138|nr:hypothetical protein [Treponema berlinense]
MQVKMKDGKKEKHCRPLNGVKPKVFQSGKKAFPEFQLNQSTPPPLIICIEAKAPFLTKFFIATVFIALFIDFF